MNSQEQLRALQAQLLSEPPSSHSQKNGVHDTTASQQHVKSEAINQSSLSSGLLVILEERQGKILSRLPNFAKVTVSAAIVGFVGTTIIQLITGTLPKERFGLVSLSQPTLGTMIGLLLSLFSILIMWVFVFWSLSFIPYVAYHAYKGAQKTKLMIGTKAFRWVQLYASTFLPMAIFAVAWNSTTSGRDITIEIVSLYETAFVVLGAVIICTALWVINWAVPTRFIALRLSLLSSLLYASLFLTYGLGYSPASYSTLFGIFLYLILGFNQLEEIVRRITTYDIDPRVADKLNEIASKFQELQVAADGIKISQMASDVMRSQNEQQIEASRIEGDTRIQDQLSEMETAKAEFNNRTMSTLLIMFKQKHVLLTTMYKILSEELSGRMEQEIPKKIQQLEANAKNYTPEKIFQEMRVLKDEINTGLQWLPEGLKDLRSEMEKAFQDFEREIRKVDKYLVNDSNENRR